MRCVHGIGGECGTCDLEFTLVADARLEEMEAEIARYKAALVELSTHDFTSAAGCRRGQTIAAKALRGER